MLGILDPLSDQLRDRQVIHRVEKILAQVFRGFLEMIAGIKRRPTATVLIAYPTAGIHLNERRAEAGSS